MAGGFDSMGVMYEGSLPLRSGTTKQIPPAAGIEKQQYRIQFQPPGQHIKDQHHLAQRAEESKVPGRTNLRQAGANVVKGGSHSGKIGDRVIILQAQQKNRDSSNQHIGDKKRCLHCAAQPDPPDDRPFRCSQPVGG